MQRRRMNLPLLNLFAPVFTGPAFIHRGARLTKLRQASQGRHYLIGRQCARMIDYRLAIVHRKALRPPARAASSGSRAIIFRRERLHD